MFILEAVKNILDYRTVELPTGSLVHLNEKDILVNEEEGHEESCYFLNTNYRTKSDFEYLLNALSNDKYVASDSPLNYKEKFYLHNF